MDLSSYSTRKQHKNENEKKIRLKLIISAWNYQINKNNKPSIK